jgi:hypothetical protein
MRITINPTMHLHVHAVRGLLLLLRMVIRCASSQFLVLVLVLAAAVAAAAARQQWPRVAGCYCLEHCLWAWQAAVLWGVGLAYSCALTIQHVY